MPAREVQPGKVFESIVRPPLARPAFPWRVEFGHVHLLDAHGVAHAVNAHRHPHYELIVVRAGEYRCDLNRVDTTARPGQALLLKPGDWHRDNCAPGMACSVVVFRVFPGPTPTTSANLLRDDLAPAEQVVDDVGGILLALVARMCDEGRRGDPFSVPLLDSLAQEAAWQLLRLLPSGRLDPRILGGMELHGFGSRLLEFCDRHVASSPSAGAMAAALGLSERALAERCRAAYGTSPAKFFTRYRLERARLLLVQTDLPVKAIAEHLGFENPYHFSTVYKRVHGVSPTHHRP